MGGKSSKADKLAFDNKDWDEVERADFHEVVRHRENGLEGNRYHFNIKSERKLADEVDIYHRRKSASNWIQVIGAKVEKGGFGFCGSQDSANVITERIPFTLNNVGRLNRDESNVVLYNALKGFSNVSSLVVPGPVNDKMIGFTPAGHTKVWVNENFGMNYPVHYDDEAELHEGDLIHNVTSAIAPHADLQPDYVSALSNSGNFNNALNFIRTNSGVPSDLLEGNRIDVARHAISSVQPVNILHDNVPVSTHNHHVPSVQGGHYVHTQHTSTSHLNPVHHNQPLGYNTTTTGYHQSPNVHFGHGATTTGHTSVNFGGVSSSGYQPNRFTSTDVAGVDNRPKFSFTANQ